VFTSGAPEFWVLLRYSGCNWHCGIFGHSLEKVSIDIGLTEFPAFQRALIETDMLTKSTVNTSLTTLVESNNELSLALLVQASGESVAVGRLKEDVIE